MDRNGNHVGETASASDAADERARSQPRDSLFLGAQLWFAGAGVSLPLRVRNLSATGALLESTVAVRMGDKVHIEVSGMGKLAATVIWVATPQPAGHRFGVAFDLLVDPQAARRPSRVSDFALSPTLRDIGKGGRAPIGTAHRDKA